MVDWRAAVAQVATNVEEHFDVLKYRLEQRLGLLQPVQIVPYIGHGIRQRLHVRGRVLRNRGITSAKDNDTVWENLVNMYKRFESDEVRFARVRARFGDTAQEVVANEEGFFDVHIPLDEPLPTDNVWHEIAYVSSSPWNLYDLLVDFFDIRGIPLGPLFLADWGLSTDTLLTPAHRVHKIPTIQNLLETHPRLPFLLIGDSGQQDPEIYLEVVRHNPGRIPVVYIRDVASAKRDAEVHAIAEEVRRAGSEMVLAKDSAAAAEHAAARGFILPPKLGDVRKERDEDLNEPTPLERLLAGEP
jgi:phosphatidate phosphatase APP1